MTVYAYVGRPGAGKSYGVVENSIVPACMMGRPVYTNIPVHIDELLDEYPKTKVARVDTAWFDDDENLMSIPGGALVVIDEAWRIFPAGQKLSNVSKLRSSFFAEHRHRVGENGLSQDIVIVVQDLTKIAAWARADIDKTFVATKLDGAGMDNKFRVDIYQGMRKGPQYPAPDLGFSIQEYRPGIYRFYQSHTLGTGAAGLEIKPDKRATVLSHPMVKWGVPFGVVCAILGIFFVASFFVGRNKHKPAPAPSPAVAKPAPVQAPPAPVPAPAPPKPGPAAAAVSEPAPPPVPPLSKDWRITGVSLIDGRRIVLAESGRGHRRRIDPAVCSGWDFEPECTVDGQRISRYSGPARKPRDLTSVADLNPIEAQR